MPNSIVKFWDADIRPPKGGWSYPIAGQLVTRYSESDILQDLIKWQRNNQQFVSRETSLAQLWEYWCAKQPDRCGGPSKVLHAARGPAVSQRERTREVQGPPIWNYLATMAASWIPEMHDYFLHTCNWISVILECPECRQHWREVLSKFPPQNLHTRLEVCQWVNRVHNEVNASIGKPQYPYLAMCAEFGAPLP